jgi:Ca-activated chloride channel family protein
MNMTRPGRLRGSRSSSSLLWALLLVSFATLCGSLARTALGQSQRPRQVAPPKREAPPQPIPQTKPTPTPTPQNPPTKTEPPPEPSEVIRIDSNLVAVPVSVTDAAGQPVRGLTEKDFRLEEEGQPQQIITLGEPGQTPVELALLFDVSGSIHERFQFEQQAAARFLREVLKPNDSAAIFSIGLAPRLVQARTIAVEQAVTGVSALRPTKEATAFFDAVVEAAHYLGNHANPGTRRVLVVISDGEDNHSERHKLADALRELQRADCLFYAINPSGPSIRLNKISLKGQDGMATLAAQTGGAAFLPDKLEDLDAVFRQIAAELQAQYLLGYYSSDERADGKFRRITVRVPKRSDLRVRARQGYYPPKQ